MAAKNPLLRIARSFSTIIAEETKSKMPIRIWWDLDSYVTTISTVTEEVPNLLRSHNFKGPLDIQVYGNLQILPSFIKSPLAQYDLKLNHVSSDMIWDWFVNKTGLINVMVGDMQRWCLRHPPPFCHVLLSRYSNFASTVDDLRARGYRVLFADPCPQKDDSKIVIYDGSFTKRSGT